MEHPPTISIDSSKYSNELFNFDAIIIKRENFFTNRKLKHNLYYYVALHHTSWLIMAYSPSIKGLAKSIPEIDLESIAILDYIDIEGIPFIASDYLRALQK
jgi:hypothetical protein